MKLGIAGLIGLAALATCNASFAQPQPQRPEATATAQGMESIELPAALDRVLRDYEQAWRADDADALALLFTEDGFVLQSGQPPVRGREAIRNAYRGQGGSPLRLRALAYDTGGNSGAIIGTYGFGQNVTETGKFTLTLHRSAQGKWLIRSDMENMNRPPQGRPPAGTP